MLRRLVRTSPRGRRRPRRRAGGAGAGCSRRVQAGRPGRAGERIVTRGDRCTTPSVAVAGLSGTVASKRGPARPRGGPGARRDRPRLAGGPLAHAGPHAPSARGRRAIRCRQRALLPRVGAGRRSAGRIVCASSSSCATGRRFPLQTRDSDAAGAAGLADLLLGRREGDRARSCRGHRVRSSHLDADRLRRAPRRTGRGSAGARRRAQSGVGPHGHLDPENGPRRHCATPTAWACPGDGAATRLCLAECHRRLDSRGRGTDYQLRVAVLAALAARFALPGEGAVASHGRHAGTAGGLPSGRWPRTRSGSEDVSPLLLDEADPDLVEGVLRPAGSGARYSRGGARALDRGCGRMPWRQGVGDRIPGDVRAGSGDWVREQVPELPAHDPWSRVGGEPATAIPAPASGGRWARAALAVRYYRDGRRACPARMGREARWPLPLSEDSSLFFRVFLRDYGVPPAPRRRFEGTLGRTAVPRPLDASSVRIFRPALHRFRHCVMSCPTPEARQARR